MTITIDTLSREEQLEKIFNPEHVRIEDNKFVCEVKISENREFEEAFDRSFKNHPISIHWVEVGDNDDTYKVIAERATDLTNFFIFNGLKRTHLA